MQHAERRPCSHRDGKIPHAAEPQRRATAKGCHARSQEPRQRHDPRGPQAARSRLRLGRLPDRHPRPALHAPQPDQQAVLPGGQRGRTEHAHRGLEDLPPLARGGHGRALPEQGFRRGGLPVQPAVPQRGEGNGAPLEALRAGHRSRPGDALGQLYVEKTFGADKGAHEQDDRGPHRGLREDIESLPWDDSGHRQKALVKLQAFNKGKVGYPDKWKDYCLRRRQA